MTKLSELRRKLFAKETEKIKKRQASLLERTAKENNIEISPENITLNSGRVQSTFRKNYK